MGSERGEFNLKVAQSSVALFGLILASFGAWQAYLTYRQSAELQALRALDDAQLTVCEELTSTAAAAFSAGTRDELTETYRSFAKLKHGRALMLLDKDVLDHAVVVHNNFLDALDLADGEPHYRERVRCILSNAPFDLALACRRMMGKAFQREAHDAIEPIDPDYVMRWNAKCEAE
jgi:hypothetical protein